jgi:GTP pyrophosphokinase
VIKAAWVTSEEEGPFSVNLKITGKDELGLVNNISHFLTAEMRIKVETIHFDKRNERFEGNVLLFVRDTKQLDYIISRLQKINGVQKITRIK